MRSIVSRNLTFTILMLAIVWNCKTACAQKSRPGLPGMAPSKWITIRNTQAPGRVYGVAGHPAKTYKHEDVFIKAWIPVVNSTRMAILLGPQYRTEMLEFRGSGENPLARLSNWNLRSMGLDLRSCITLDSTSWLAVGANISQSGNLRHQSQANVPFSYTFTSAYIRRTSPNKEIGFGMMVNRSFDRMTILPVFLLHYNYSSRGGFEVSLPYRLSWRNNLSKTDILYVKAEGVTRSYWINDDDKSYAFRRTEADFGLAYNKQFNRFVGAEIFGGYRKNIRTRLPEDVLQVKTSGMVFTMELYIRPPFSK